MVPEDEVRKQIEAWRAAELAARESQGDAAQRPGAARGQLTAASGIEYLTYGQPDAADGETPPCELLATTGSVEGEYAAIRKGAGVLWCPQRATLEIAGTDRNDFLQRMVTADVGKLGSGRCTGAFWLNRKGRIESDLLLVETGDRVLADVDTWQADATVSTLDGFLFTEDVQLSNASAAWSRLALHGRLAPNVLAALGAAPADEPGRVVSFEIDGHRCYAARVDETGEPGFVIFAPAEVGPATWRALVETDDAVGGGGRRVRPVGWYAYNIARIEAGVPLFNVDFGATNLPHETGVLEERVSFTKGCYPGQEIVARLHNLGRPKQLLVGLKMRDDKLPVAGGQVFARVDDGMGDQVGVVTSSTLSPMLGATPIAFAMMRTETADAGAPVLVNAEGEQGLADVTPLQFWPEPSPPEKSETQA